MRVKLTKYNTFSLIYQKDDYFLNIYTNSKNRGMVIINILSLFLNETDFKIKL